MWCIALAILGTLYAIRISKEWFRSREIRNSVKLLDNFCIAYPSNHYEKQLNSLLENASVIRGYVSEPRLSRTLLPNANYENASRIRLKMMDKLDEQRHIVRKSFDPSIAVRDLILLPVTVLHWLGFAPGRIASTILANAWWILQYLLDTFQPEIKELLIELVRKLIAN